MNIFRQIIKRIAIVIALFLGFPIILLISIIIVIDSGFPVFHLREVMGLNNKIFTFYKFRTMVKNADEVLNLGKEIFLEKGNCAQCHALSDAGSNGDIGPNLNEIKPEVGRVVMAVTNGIGVMPAYEGMLTSKEIEAVAIYVSEKSN